jgi:hypothetical protein
LEISTATSKLAAISDGLGGVGLVNNDVEVVNIVKVVMVVKDIRTLLQLEMLLDKVQLEQRLYHSSILITE